MGNDEEYLEKIEKAIVDAKEHHSRWVQIWSEFGVSKKRLSEAYGRMNYYEGVLRGLYIARKLVKDVAEYRSMTGPRKKVK